jgi:glutaminyl-peptide cyclotransferase
MEHKFQRHQQRREKTMKSRHVALTLAVIAVIVFGGAALVLVSNSPSSSEPANYTYTIINVYPHDKTAFTQGLVFEDGVLYEGTGLYGQSTLRRVDLETGNVTQLHSLPSNLFGEGITIFDDKIIQLTWMSGRGFVYDKNSFELLQEFTYSTEEGWGITNNGSNLIMTDGKTANLYFLDPESFQIIDQVEVIDEEPVTNRNELEYIDGRVYANIWMTEKIAIINPETGQVTGWINLEGLDAGNPNADVLNGIAYDTETGRLFVTGKLWSNLYEIKLVPQE